nr:DUF2752 domain-containing protein [Corynebacterium sp. TAE3-ERU12]
MVAAANPQQPGGPIPVCPSKALLGVNCPICGCSRMVQALVQGDFVAAAQFNALGVAAVVFLIWAWLVWGAASVGVVAPRYLRPPRLGPWVVWVLIGWTVIRLIPLAPVSALQV